MMIIVEQFLQAKTGILLDCADRIFVNCDFACVADGATSQSKRRWQGLTPGNYAAELACKAIGSFHKSITKSEAIRRLTEAFASTYRSSGLYEHVQQNAMDRLTVSIVLFSRYHSEIWMIGDCQCLVNDMHVTNPNPLGEFLADIRALFLETELLAGKSVAQLRNHDTGRAFILPLLRRQSLFSDSTTSQFSFAIIDGFEVNEDLTKTIKVGSDVNSIVLASDGYPRLLQTLRESEEALIDIVAADPLCMLKYKSTKGVGLDNVSFDDRAYLKIQL